MIEMIKQLFAESTLRREEQAVDDGYEPYRQELKLAGLSEKKLRKMSPDDRVEALEQASLDPYDYIYLAC